jgi:Na+/melibiose symporter-like transporter
MCCMRNYVHLHLAFIIIIIARVRSKLLTFYNNDIMNLKDVDNVLLILQVLFITFIIS